jgi:NAD(P)-dependent dehydrogenase (short-subunit alcohol dehydrogenase family)
MNKSHFSCEGKIALVTGASSGIGEVLAKALSDAGAKVIVAARRQEKLAQLVKEINHQGGTAMAVSMDVTARASVNAAIAEGMLALGTPTIVINNAGVASPRSFVSTEESARDYVMDTNFNGVWNVAQECARRMIDSGQSGSIVNIASVLGLTVKPGQTSYCASKGAVIQLTRAMALDLIKHGIRVNAIAPGWFRTEINAEFFDSDAGKEFITRMPAKRLGRLDELVAPVLMLCSDSASFVNGVVLTVDGAISVAGL